MYRDVLQGSTKDCGQGTDLFLVFNQNSEKLRRLK